MIKMLLVSEIMMKGLSQLYPILSANHHILFEDDMPGAWQVIVSELIGPWEIWIHFEKCYFQSYFTDWYLHISLW